MHIKTKHPWRTVSTVIILRTCCIHLPQIHDLQHEFLLHSSIAHSSQCICNFCGCATELKTWRAWTFSAILVLQVPVTISYLPLQGVTDLPFCISVSLAFSLRAMKFNVFVHRIHHFLVSNIRCLYLRATEAYLKLPLAIPFSLCEVHFYIVWQKQSYQAGKDSILQ